jgi:hypothetical protein
LTAVQIGDHANWQLRQKDPGIAAGASDGIAGRAGQPSSERMIAENGPDE